MRLLFVSGTSMGGAARSTHALAAALHGRGHDVGTLMRRPGAPVRTYVHKRAVNLATKLEARPALARAVEGAAGLLGRTLLDAGTGAPYWAREAYLPENAIAGAHRARRPEVVVANSIERTAWRRVRADLARRGVPSVLYLREQTSLGHLSVSHAPPDLLLANSEHLASEARALGHEATVVPSIVEPDAVAVESTRERVVMVNPLPLFGLDTTLAMAHARPDVPFALVESWPLDQQERRALEERVAGLPNVKVRPLRADARTVYADARVVVAPYRHGGRSRVVLEAQLNGIPVIATADAGLAEAVGPGGVLVDPAAPDDAWVRALGSLWDDAAAYEQVSRAAREHATRPEVQPAAVVAAFEHAVERLLARAAGATPAPSREPR